MVVSNRGQPDISVRLREDISVRLRNRTIGPVAQEDRLSGCRDPNGNRRIGRVSRRPGTHRPTATGRIVRLPGFQRFPDPRTNVQPVPVGLPTTTRRPPLHGQKSHPLKLDQHPTHVPIRLPGTPRQRPLRGPRHTSVIGLIRQSQQHQRLRRPQLLELPHPVRRPRTHLAPPSGPAPPPTPKSGSLSPPAPRAGPDRTPEPENRTSRPPSHTPVAHVTLTGWEDTRPGALPPRPAGAPSSTDPRDRAHRPPDPGEATTETPPRPKTGEEACTCGR